MNCSLLFARLRRNGVGGRARRGRGSLPLAGALALAVLALAWLFLQWRDESVRRATLAPDAGNRAQPATELQVEAAPLVMHAPSVRARREPIASAPDGSWREPHGRPSRVSVTGSIRRDGRPVTDIDLSFAAIGSPVSAPTLREWDFADEHGHYEVQLLPGPYLVVDAAGEPLTAVFVPGGPSELELDIDL